MPATPTALIVRQPGASVITAFPQVTPNGIASQNLDLLQIIGEGGNVLINVDHAGTVHSPAVSPTNGTRLQADGSGGVFYSRLTSSATAAQIFADAFENLSQQDILQVINVGGNISYYLNYQGVATGS
jgi:hypothetical protein